MTQDSAAWNYAVSNPKTAGAIVGVLAAPAAEAGLSAAVAAKAVTAVGVGAAYMVKQAAAAIVYGLVTAGSLQAIPDTMGVLSNQNTTDQSKYASTMFNIGSQIIPGFAGKYVGAVSDVLQFVQTVGNKIMPSQKVPTKSNENSSQRRTRDGRSN